MQVSVKSPIKQQGKKVEKKLQLSMKSGIKSKKKMWGKIAKKNELPCVKGKN